MTSPMPKRRRIGEPRRDLHRPAFGAAENRHLGDQQTELASVARAVDAGECGGGPVEGQQPFGHGTVTTSAAMPWPPRPVSATAACRNIIHSLPQAVPKRSTADCGNQRMRALRPPEAGMTMKGKWPGNYLFQRWLERTDRILPALRQLRTALRRQYRISGLRSTRS